jgi:hypothetical protein
MQQKQVKIIGLSLNQQLGILKACNLTFDQENRLQKILGCVGQGKTTLKTALDLGTKGSKTLVDKSLYGEVDCETQLLDGEQNIFVGCKTDKTGSLVYTLYTKDINGKIIREPVIDGEKATPAKYLEKLQTELTWRMNDLVSENPIIQRNLLLDLYKSELKRVGVIFDKKDPNFANSILDQVDQAIKSRDYMDMIRKQKGGIKEDLILQGFDPDRPNTTPDYTDLTHIDSEIMKLQNSISLSKQELENTKNSKLRDLTNEAEKVILAAKNYNNTHSIAYNNRLLEYEKAVEVENKKAGKIEDAKRLLTSLRELGYNGSEVLNWILTLPESVPVLEPTKTALIEFGVDGKIVTPENFENCDDQVKAIFMQLQTIRHDYKLLSDSEVIFDSSEIDNKILALEEIKSKAKITNRIVDAIDSFHAWRKSNDEVLRLKTEYYKKLSEVNTGVEGLKIVCEETSGDIFLTYNGIFDPEYFNNPTLEQRKLASYSGTQKPLICLLIQHYLLSLKPKALRYMYIDNVPMDKRTQEVLLSMCEKLDLTIFLTVTGDFEKDSLHNGEILIEGGEVFFGNN